MICNRHQGSDLNKSWGNMHWTFPALIKGCFCRETACKGCKDLIRRVLRHLLWVNKAPKDVEMEGHCFLLGCRWYMSVSPFDDDKADKNIPGDLRYHW